MLRLRLASLTRLPSLRAWCEVALAAGLFALIAYPLAEQAGLVSAFWWSGLGSALLLFGRVLVAPALVEELIFRGLLNPPPGQATCSARFGWGAGSLALYVSFHPLSAWLFRPEAFSTFSSPTFLLLTVLLGFLCLTLYLRSGSLWSAVILHAAVVASWALLGGLELLQV